MQAFVPARGGFASRLDTVERRVVSRLVGDVAELLGADGGTFAAPPGPAASDAEVLAALDFDPAPPEGAAEDRPPSDPALLRLLPPMSRDEELAGELRALTENGLRQGKIARLGLLIRALAEAEDGTVHVPEPRAGEWLAALTDVRLVLATRLGIEDEEDAEAVHQQVWRATEHPRPEGDEVTQAMATMYAALTWWQESLLQAIGRRNPRR